MTIDLRHRPTLLKSWLATLHGPDLTARPRLVGPLPGWSLLLRTALAWHLAYALVAYAGAVAVARSGSTTAVAAAVQSGGTPAVVTLTLTLWWGGVVLSTVLWWTAVRRARAEPNAERQDPRAQTRTSARR